MDCVSCDSDSDFNRIAVDRPSGEISGTICEQCEEDLVSRSSESTVSTMAACLICGDCSDFLFPEWDSIVETDDGLTMFEYTITLTTPAICEGCLTASKLLAPVQTPEGGESD